MKKISNRFWIFFLTIVFESTSTYLFSQHQLDSTLRAIPLEAYDGFNQDSFTLPGDLHAQAVYPYGHYQSKVKIKLDGIGEVFVHHVLYFDEEEYSFMELYTREPDSLEIWGIKRYGNFRTYDAQGYRNDSCYERKPRVEFVQGLNTIKKTIFPLSIFNINHHQELKMIVDNQPVAASVELTLKNCDEYLDTLVAGKVEHGCGWYGWVEYRFLNNTISVSLSLFGGMDYSLSNYECIFYDSTGTNIGRVHGNGPLTYYNLTENHKYVFTNTGGGMDEDYVAPYTANITELSTGKVIFSKRSNTDYIVVVGITSSNLGVFKIGKDPGTAYSDLESYVIDLDKDIMYAIHLNPLCEPPFTASFFPTYCECWKKNGLKTKLQYERDFPVIRFKRME